MSGSITCHNISQATTRRLASDLISYVTYSSSSSLSSSQYFELASQVRNDRGIARVDPLLCSTISTCLEATGCCVNRDFVEAYNKQSIAHDQCLEYFSKREDNINWIIPFFVHLATNLRQYAIYGDQQNEDSNHTLLRDAINALTRSFTIAAKDRTPITDPNSKKLVIFAFTTLLLKTYFCLNTLQLSSKLISVVEGPGGVINSIQFFPVGQVVMYKYYIGRLRLFEDRYDEARDCLRYALKFIPLQYKMNRCRILISLIAIEMYLGIMPTKHVADVYGLHEMYAIGQAIAKGDLRSFNNLMTQHQASFIRHGIYLVLEQTKLIAYRNLLRKIAQIRDTTRIPLSDVQTALQWLGEDISFDEIECIIANLMYQGRVKGYISHERRFLILSKNDAFPTSSVIVPPQSI